MKFDKKIHFKEQRLSVELHAGHWARHHQRSAVQLAMHASKQMT